LFPAIRIESLTQSDVFSLIALLFSIAALVITVWQRKVIAKENVKMRKAEFFIKRNYDFEGKLGDWPKALEIYGIKKEDWNNSVVSPEQIAYLILSIHSLIAYCRVEDLPFYKYISESDYRYKMFSNEVTRAVWKFAREAFSENTSKWIDAFLLVRFNVLYDKRIFKILTKSIENDTKIEGKSAVLVLQKVTKMNLGYDSKKWACWHSREFNKWFSENSQRFTDMNANDARQDKSIE